MVQAQEPSSRTDGALSYELLLEIGSGGMAKVYLARAVGMAGFERYVAIKCCHANLSDDEQFAGMFLDEARIAARIHHPNVVPTLDVGKSDVLFLVMEYVEGDRVSQLIRAAAKHHEHVPLPIALRIAVDALAGLHCAHELRDEDGTPLHIVHRDVTPQNIIVGVDGVSRILDFGIASAASRATTTKEGHVKGKLGYLAPEQLSFAPAGRQADIYALGVVLWEVLAGRRLFRGESDAVVIAQITQGLIPPLQEFRPEVPPALEAIVRRAIAREPADRYPTAAAFSLALEGAGIPIASARATGDYVRARVDDLLQARRAQLREVNRANCRVLRSGMPSVAAPRPASWVHRDGAPWIATVGVIALLAGVAWMLTRSRTDSPPVAADAPAPAQEPLPLASPAHGATPSPPPPPAPVLAADAGTPASSPTHAEAVTKPSTRRTGKRKRKGDAETAGEWWPGRL